jgi:hypothetical protein
MDLRRVKEGYKVLPCFLFFRLGLLSILPLVGFTLGMPLLILHGLGFGYKQTQLVIVGFCFCFIH